MMEEKSMRTRFLLLMLLSFWNFSAYANKSDYSILRGGNRYVEETGDFYRDKIQPILASRCVTCHSCTSAPCQLNLSSYAGLVRGLSKENPNFAGLSRLFREATRARLEDGFSEHEWRQRGFYPVLPKGSIHDSILYLALVEEDDDNQIPDDNQTKTLLSLLTEEKFECPVDAGEYRSFRERYPFSTMPLTCQKLPYHERQTLLDWLEVGAPGPMNRGLAILSKPTLTSKSQLSCSELDLMIQQFEDFLNPSSMRGRAVARYLFEHLYAVNIHFTANPGEFYRIVRSRTPYPQDIDLIVTEFITDDPKTSVYYRLQKLDQVIELKRHIPFEINEAILKEWENIFFAKDQNSNWGYLELVNTYPNNPFEWFQVIPVMARARFVEKYAKTLMQVVARGAICHGNTPSYVSPDYVWFLIFKPESDPTVQIPDLGMKTVSGQPNFKEFYSHPRDVAHELIFPPNYPWRAQTYNKHFLASLDTIHPDGIGLDDLSSKEMFFGLRHETSLEFYSVKEISVPGYTDYKILWSYADYEHFYYRTSVHYKYYGSGAHKFEAFYTVIQRRSLGEYVFALLNPDYKLRRQLLDWFTTDKGKRLYSLQANLLRYDSPFRKSKEPDQSFALLSQKILQKFEVYQSRSDLVHFHDSIRSNLDVELKPTIKTLKDFEAGLRTLTGKRGTFARFVPNVVHLRLNEAELYSLFVHRGHKNDKVIAEESSALDPNYDQLSVAKGLVGAFSYMFFDLSFDQSRDFIEQMSKLESKEDWQRVVNQFGIKRDSKQFYPFLDWMHAWIGSHLKDEGGLMDIRYYGL